MNIEHPKRKAAIAIALLGFYLTSSTAMAIFLFMVGLVNYLSIIVATLRQLPPTAPRPPTNLPSMPKAVPASKAPHRKLHFEPSDNPAQALQSVQSIIQQNMQKPANSQQSCLKISDSGYRTKPHPSC